MTSFVDNLKKGYVKGMLKRPIKKAQKTSSTEVIVKVYGVNEMTMLREIGFSIVSHSPSNYAHADNRYVMSMPLEQALVWWNNAQA